MKTFGTIAGSSLVVAILALAGCATTPPASVSTPAISAVPPQGMGRIVFYRTSGIWGYGMRPDIFLDGRKVGQSVPGAKFNVHVPPGTYRVTVPNSMYEGERKLSLTLREREIVYVRTSLGGSALGGRTNVEVVPAAEAEGESSGLELAGS